MKVNEMCESERPRERALKYGLNALSNSELLALFIRCGYQGVSAIDLASLILKEYQLNDLISLDYKELIKIKGISKAKALEILAIVELAKRISNENCLNEDIMLNTEDLKKYLILNYGHLKQENVVAIYLDTQNHIILTKTIFIGSLNTSIFHPREIFKEAVACSASKIILAHNHPSGGLKPSNKDLEMTERIIEAGQMMSIELVDHYIVTKNQAISIKNREYL